MEKKEEKAYMYIRNVKTGEIFCTENDRMRLYRMRRRILSWSRIVGECEYYKECRKVMFSLTYEPGKEWEKNDIRDFNLALRKYIPKEKLLGYAWVAEMQERGAVHYHAYWLFYKDIYIPEPDKSFWDKGSSKITTGNSPYYLVTYVGKEEQKEGYPKGLRAYSVYLNKKLVSKMEYKRYELSGKPRWLVKELEENYKGVVYPEFDKMYGGYLVRERGESFFIRSPYVRDYVEYRKE